MNLKNKTILITGGTGTFGQVMVKSLLKIRGIKKIIIYSRDDFKQQHMRKKIDSKILRYFIGDIRDKSRLTIATIGVDLIIHAAALKHVDVAEYNPTEFVETNIFGAKNLIEVCSQNKIKKVVALSTDKASSPINLYGATKLCSDKLFIAANNYIVGTIFSVVRYGNVEGSRGSVIPFFKSLVNTNIFPVTSKEMTRFSLSADEAIKMVFWVIKHSIGQEVVVPKTASYRILDLVNAFSKKPKIKIIGIRPGEKLHEELISENDSLNTFELKNYYVILARNNKIMNYYKKIFKAKLVSKNFSYKSNTNKKFLKSLDLRKIISRLP
jgi:UDP-N-acetylglucosamine 4,6-dehydratase (inverting)